MNQKIIIKLIESVQKLKIKEDDVLIFKECSPEVSMLEMNFLLEELRSAGFENVLIFLRKEDLIEKISIENLLMILENKLKKIGIDIEKYKVLDLLRIMSQFYIVGSRALSDLKNSEGLWFDTEQDESKKHQICLKHQSISQFENMLNTVKNVIESEKENKKN